VGPPHAIALAALSAVWGAAYLLIAEAIGEIPGSVVVLGRVGLAALALLVLVWIQGGERRRLLADARRRPGPVLTPGLFAIRCRSC
jgi:drug/metabolite transporter (DMT)-like permease